MVNEDIDKLMSNTFTIFKTIFILGLLLITGILYVVNRNQHAKIISNDQLNKSMMAEIELYETKEGLHAAKIQAFEASSAKDFTKLATKDSTILKLQKLVKEKSDVISKYGSATIINTESYVDISVPTKPIDSTIISNGEKYPVYKADFNLGGWVWGNTIAAKDSTYIKLKYREELSLVIGKEKTGFLGLGKGIPYGDVTLSNPFSEVTEMRVYNTKLPRVKRFGVGPSVSYGIGERGKSGYFVGIGVSYDVIQF